VGFKFDLISQLKLENYLASLDESFLSVQKITRPIKTYQTSKTFTKVTWIQF